MSCAQDGIHATQILRPSARRDEYTVIGHSCFHSSATISAIAKELVSPGLSIPNSLIILPLFLSPHSQYDVFESLGIHDPVGPALIEHHSGRNPSNAMFGR